MQKPQGRKYQVVEEAEIDLVLKCRDSHEFYEQYLKVFPETKKGLDSISKIWKRRSEFAKKRPQTLPQAETGSAASREIQALIAEQTKIMSDMAALTKENLEVSRKILSALAHQNHILTRGMRKNQKIPRILPRSKNHRYRRRPRKSRLRSWSVPERCTGFILFLIIPRAYLFYYDNAGLNPYIFLLF